MAEKYASPKYAPVTRVRAVLSCLPCRKAKTACDRAEPKCKRCVRMGLPCGYVNGKGVGGESAEDDEKGDETGQQPSVLGKRKSDDSSACEVSSSLRFPITDLQLTQKRSQEKACNLSST